MEPSDPTSELKLVDADRLLYLVNHCRGFLPTRDEWEEVVKLVNAFVKDDKEMRALAIELLGRSRLLRELQQKRMVEASKLYQHAHGLPESDFPDLGELLRWLLKERDAADQLAGALEWSMSSEYDEYMDPYYDNRPDVRVGDRRFRAGEVRTARAALAAYRAGKADGK